MTVKKWDNPLLHCSVLSVFSIWTSFKVPLFLLIILTKVNYPCTGLCRPQGCRRFRLPGVPDSRHMQVIRLSALHTGRLYRQGNPWCWFLLQAEWTPGLLNADRRIRSLEKLRWPHWESSLRPPALWYKSAHTLFISTVRFLVILLAFSKSSPDVEEQPVGRKLRKVWCPKPFCWLLGCCKMWNSFRRVLDGVIVFFEMSWRIAVECHLAELSEFIKFCAPQSLAVLQGSSPSLDLSHRSLKC